MASFAIGVGVSPVNLLPGLKDQPTGPSLIALMRREGVRIVRLVAETPNPQPGAYKAMHAGGWRDVFEELASAHIDAILLIGGDAGVNGVKVGSWPPEPPSPSFPAPGQTIESTARWIANQGAILADIKRQCGGYPPNLVAIEAANEPLVTNKTLPMLRRDIRAIHTEAPRIPVTIAGWRTPARHAGEHWDFNNPVDAPLVVPLVDYVTVHMYLDNLPTLPADSANRVSADPGIFLKTARLFLNQIIADSRGKPIFVGEFGGVDGRPRSWVTDPVGGTPAHQAAVIQASSEAMFADRSRGVTGGTIWLLEQNEGAGYPCSSFDLLCFGKPPMTPALQTLSRDARL